VPGPRLPRAGWRSRKERLTAFEAVEQASTDWPLHSALRCASGAPVRRGFQRLVAVLSGSDSALASQNPHCQAVPAASLLPVAPRRPALPGGASFWLARAICAEHESGLRILRRPRCASQTAIMQSLVHCCRARVGVHALPNLIVAPGEQMAIGVERRLDLRVAHERLFGGDGEQHPNPLQAFYRRAQDREELAYIPSERVDLRILPVSRSPRS
jgi:hypothetical protein